MDTLTLPPFERLTSPRIEVDAAGIPLLFGSIVDPGGNDGARFDWADTSWTLSWLLGQGAGFFWPILSPSGEPYLLWRGTDPENRNYLFLAQAFRDSVATPDTVARVCVSANMYSAVVTSRRRWVVVSDVIFQTGAGDLRLFYSDTLGSWREIEVGGQGHRGVAVTALDDTTALVAWAGDAEGLRWGIARGDTWEAGHAPLAGGLSGHPRFRPRPSGGQWLIWITKSPYAGVAHYEDGLWSVPDTIRCAYPDSLAENYASDSADVSREGAEYPAVAWSAFNSLSGASTICVSVPTDSGFGRADEIRNFQDDVGARVTRDRNGDVWVAFQPFAQSGIFWTHTYARATASAPTVASASGQPMLSWTLSEPAPETWWAVLRATGDGPFEPVVRVRAGPEIEMSWTDSTAPTGVELRYRIRRESVDARYRWETQDTVVSVWHPPVPRLALRVSGSSPVVGIARLEVLGAAAGPLRLEFYDIRGRLVGKHEAAAAGEGRDSVSVPLGPLALGPSVYLARVRDSRGVVSEPIKLVVLE